LREKSRYGPRSTTWGKKNYKGSERSKSEKEGSKEKGGGGRECGEPTTEKKKKKDGSKGQGTVRKKNAGEGGKKFDLEKNPSKCRGQSILRVGGS